MKSFLRLSLLLIALVGCGSHSQSLVRVESKQPVKQVGETDIVLQTFNAAESGDLKELHRLVEEEGADINVHNNEGLTLIMAVIRAEQFAVLEYLVGHEIDQFMETKSEIYDPSINARQYVEKNVSGETTRNIIGKILNREQLTGEDLNESWYGGIDDFNFGIVRWLYEKGADPNHKVMTGSSGKVKTTPLIYLFSKRGVEDNPENDVYDFTNLKLIFNLLVSDESIDLNVQDRRRQTALDKARSRAEDNSNYQPMVEKLISLGAH